HLAISRGICIVSLLTIDFPDTLYIFLHTSLRASRGLEGKRLTAYEFAEMLLSLVASPHDWYNVSEQLNVQ
ncbi:hypothetical protein BGZ58_001829, partial [Dissophora ornata]